MRFAERALAGALWIAALGGCAAPGGVSSGKAETGAAAASVRRTAVDPATQQAFEAAVNALRAGRTDDAERDFRALALAHPELGGPHANLGLILRAAGKLAPAAAELEQAVALSPDQALFFDQLGVSYRQLGRFEEARAAYQRAIELDPAAPAPYLNLGILNDLYLNDGARALALYGQYLALSPQGDATVAKWVADLKNRKPTTVASTAKE